MAGARRWLAGALVLASCGTLHQHQGATAMVAITAIAGGLGVLPTWTDCTRQPGDHCGRDELEGGGIGLLVGLAVGGVAAAEMRGEGFRPGHAPIASGRAAPVPDDDPPPPPPRTAGWSDACIAAGEHAVVTALAECTDGVATFTPASCRCLLEKDGYHCDVDATSTCRVHPADRFTAANWHAGVEPRDDASDALAARCTDAGRAAPDASTLACACETAPAGTGSDAKVCHCIATGACGAPSTFP